MFLNKILWSLKRHPFLYKTRFKLLSKNSSIGEVEKFNYNLDNSKNEIPPAFFEVNKLIFPKGVPEDDLDRVKKLCRWLFENIKGGPGLSVTSDKALKKMVNGEGGVCSDMAQIFNNFCVINDILVREWGSTRAPFDESYGGHSFNEVFIKELNKWILIDVSYGIMFSSGERLLSVVEFYQSLRSNENVEMVSFLSSEISQSKSIHRNFLNPNTVPFLICNYSNKTYDTFLRITRPYVPVFMTHFLLFLLQKSYHYRFPLDNYREIF